jgi:hypothetical protein
MLQSMASGERIYAVTGTQLCGDIFASHTDGHPTHNPHPHTQVKIMITTTRHN